MQASLARHETLFSVHVVPPHIHIETVEFASSNSTKHVLYKSVRAHKKYSKTNKPQSHNAEKHKPLLKGCFFRRTVSKRWFAPQTSNQQLIQMLLRSKKPYLIN